MASSAFENITLDELSARYLRIHNAEKKQEYGAETIENHFQLALLYIATGQYKPVKGEFGNLYKVPEWSSFSEKSIRALEAESV